MPGIVTASLLQAEINFAVPKASLSDEQRARISARFDIDDPVPSQRSTVPIVDLRDELESGMGGRAPAEQLDARGCVPPCAIRALVQLKRKKAKPSRERQADGVGSGRAGTP